MLNYLSYVKNVLGVQNFVEGAPVVVPHEAQDRTSLSPETVQNLLNKKGLVLLALPKDSGSIDFEFLEKILASIKIEKSEFAILSDDLLAQADFRPYQGPVLLFGFSKKIVEGKFGTNFQVWEFDSLFNISQDQKIKRQTWEQLKQIQIKMKH